jgi:hypothetical protein
LGARNSAGREMFKYKLENLDGLEESQKDLYDLKDGAYFLKVDGIPVQEDVSGLKAKLDELLGEKKEAKRKADEAEAESKRLAEEAARKNGNLEAIENSWKEKLSTTENAYKDQLGSAQKKIYDLTVGSQANALASMLAVKGSESVLLPHIKQRITLDENSNIRILDLQGKPSAMSLDDLANEFRNNSAFKPLIAANVSTGGGAAGFGSASGAGKKPNEMTEQERRELKSTNPDLFIRKRI